MEQKMMTYEEQEEARKQRLEEPGNLAPCPFCGRPRVQRSTYVRCNPCGVNWLDEEMHLPNYLNRLPSAARSEAMRARMGPKTDSSARPTEDPAGSRA